MAGEQRKCANCRYFQDAGMARNGWCTHPKRQHNSDVKILVRAGELACRNSWGGDLFQSRHDSQEPVAANDTDLPGSHDHITTDRDDEVTSVVTPPDRLPSPTHSTDEDRVVSDRPARPRDEDDDTRNDAARHDQDERARIMARGNSDALRHARERHTHRRSRSSNPDDDGDEQATGDLPAERVVTHQARFTDRFASPDTSTSDRFDGSPVPKSEVERRFTTPADRFDSIPEVDPSFDLPGWRNHLDESVEESDDPSPSEDPEEDAAAPQATHDHTDRVNTYEHVLQRARRIRESKAQQSVRPIRHVRPPAQRDALEFSEPVDDAPPVQALDDTEPDLPEPNVQDAPPAGMSAPYAEIDDDLDDPAATGNWDVAEESWDDVDELVAEPDDAWLDSDETYDDEPVERSGRRPGGWLSHFGLRRRSSTHDEATITRHADTFDAWDEGDEDTYLDDVGPAVASDASDIHTGDEALLVADRWRDVNVVEDDNVAEPAFEANEPGRDDAYGSGYIDHPDPIEPYDPFGHSLDLDDEPDHVPRVAASTYAAQLRTEPWHRERPARELPDLDDNLFEETFDRPRPTSPADAIDRTPPPEEPVVAQRVVEPDAPLQSSSPRESYFRAARFREWDEGHREDTVAPDRRTGSANHLPDIDEDGIDLRTLVARGGELIDMTIDIAPDIPRECRTCRSFRSADGGARGWCTNEWAFTHRRMVNEDDLACETTIGCWWLPADRYWLIEDDGGYAAPTPRMDELIARHTRPAARKVAGE